MHILHETPVGYALFKSAPLELEAMERFASAGDAVSEIEQMYEGKVPEKIAEMIIGRKMKTIGVQSARVGESVEKKLKEKNYQVKVKVGEEVEEISRKIQERLPELLSMTEKEMHTAQLALAHALSRNKLKMSPGKLDFVMVQSTKILEKLDKDINLKSMRIREWYGQYFPELGELLSDNKRYLGILHEILRGETVTDDLREEIESAKKKTIGGEIEKEDRDLLEKTVESVMQMYVAREKLQEHLRRRMQQIAPNLLELLGEHLGAKLVEHAGSLGELANKAASTIQIMGAEASLFKTMKEKQPTPKYGYIYNSAYVGQAPYDVKGKIARTLASKIALASRCDLSGEDESGEFGRQLKSDVEKRVEALSKGNRRKEKTEYRKPEKYAVKRPSPYPSSQKPKFHKR